MGYKLSAGFRQVKSIDISLILPEFREPAPSSDLPSVEHE